MTVLLDDYQKVLQLTQYMHELATDDQWELVDNAEKDRSSIIERLKNQQLLNLTNDEKKAIELLLVEICSLNKAIDTLSSKEYDDKKSLVIDLKKSQKINQHYQLL